MLYDIEPRPTAANSVILLHESDNVAIARVPLDAGQSVEVNGSTLAAKTRIPAGHKIAIREIGPGQEVLRYGNVIGFATRAIAPGDHVHVHNVGFKELQVSDLAVPGEALVPPRLSSRAFDGYVRADGRVGTRNYIAVVAASNCAAHTAELIAQSFGEEAFPPNVDGVVAFPHGEGCGMAIGPDTTQLQRTLQGVLDHPNVSS